MKLDLNHDLNLQNLSSNNLSSNHMMTMVNNFNPNDTSNQFDISQLNNQLHLMQNTPSIGSQLGSIGSAQQMNLALNGMDGLNTMNGMIGVNGLQSIASPQPLFLSTSALS